jgi:YD repeat-containing protein
MRARGEKRRARALALLAAALSCAGCGDDRPRPPPTARGYPLPLRPGRPRSWEDDGLWNEDAPWAVSPSGNLRHRIDLVSWTMGELPIALTLVHNSADAGTALPGGDGCRIAAAARLQEGADGAVTLEEADGTPRRFVPAGDGYRGETFDVDRLSRSEHGFVLALPGGTRRSFETPAGMALLESARITRTGDRVAFRYDDGGALLAVVDGVGRSVTLHYTASQLAEIEDPEGRVFQLVHEGSALAAVVGPSLLTALVGRSPAEQPTRLELRYDDGHRVVARTSWDGSQLTQFEYDDSGRLTAVITPDGLRHRLDYQAGQVALTDSLGRTTLLRYADGAVIESVAESGLIQQIARDERHRPVQVVDGFGHRRSAEYDDGDNVTVFTDELGRKTHVTWDDHHNPITVVSSLGQTLSYHYDAFDQLLGAENALGETTEYARDDHGNLLAIVDFAGKTRLAARYDDTNRLVSVAGADGLATTLSYDDQGNLLSVTAPGAMTTRREVTPLGRTLTLTNPLGETTRLEYDVLGRVSRVTLPGGGHIDQQLDAQGRLLSLADASGPSALTRTIEWTAQDLIARSQVNNVVVRSMPPMLAALPEPTAVPCQPGCGPRCGHALPDGCGGTIDCDCAQGASCSAAGYCLGGQP